MKAKVLKDTKKKTAAMQNRSMKEDSTKIPANNPRRRAWLHPGVVGEKDSWNRQIVLFYATSYHKTVDLKKNILLGLSDDDNALGMMNKR